MARTARATSVLAAAGLAAGLLTACEPAAATFTVTTTADLTDANIGDGVCATSTGECSLRAAVQEGNTNADPGPIEVVLPAGQFSVGGTAGEDAGALGDLDLTRRFRVVGAGSGLTGSRLTAVALDRIIDVHPGGGFEARDLSMREGVADHGGLIRADGGNVTLTRVNLSVAGATGSGGLIASTDGVVTILDSQLGAAQATIGGGVAAESLVLARSVIAATEAVEGSAIALTSTTAPPSAIDTSVIDATLASTGSAVFSAGAGVVIRDSQVSDNTAPQGALSGGTGFSVGNTIFAEQTGPDCEPAVTSLGSNLESATSCGFAGPGDLASTPLVQTGFADVSGVTVAHYGAGLTVDAGAGCLATDLTGAARPADDDGDAVAECDRGPLERPAAKLGLLVTSGADAVDLRPGDGQCITSVGACTLRAAIQETNAHPAADVVMVTSSVVTSLTRAGAGEDAASTGDLDITDDVTIEGTNISTTATIDANDLDRVFDVHAGTVVLDRLKITDGTETSGGGGVRVAAGADVTVRRSAVQFNTGATGGGGGARVAGTLTIDRSLVHGNAGGPHGGGVMVAPGGVVDVVNSTIAGNQATDGSGIASLKLATIDVVDSTIAANEVGPAIERDGAVSLRNSIVADNAGGNCTAAPATFGHNLEDGATCGLIGTGDVSNTDPLLGPLQANGGPTLNMAPAAGSPARGSGVCINPTDQRGTLRPQGGACDKGAVEQ